MKNWIAGLATVLAAQLSMTAAQAETQLAVFAGGCFWCMEKPFDEIEGVKSTVSGYIGGHKKNPSYRQVSAGRTGHTEAVEIKYDPALVSYSRLLQIFWRNIDPFDAKGQFCDKGSQYRSGIFYHGQAQKQAAEASLAALMNGKLQGREIATEITAASRFYPAEGYHQDYYQKNPVRYNYYRYSCGRDKRLRQIWGAKKVKSD